MHSCKILLWIFCKFAFSLCTMWMETILETGQRTLCFIGWCKVNFLDPNLMTHRYSFIGPVPTNWINQSCTKGDSFTKRLSTLLSRIRYAGCFHTEAGRQISSGPFPIKQLYITGKELQLLTGISKALLDFLLLLLLLLLLLVCGDIPQEMCDLKLPVDNYSLLNGKNTNRGEALSEHHSC